MAHLKITGWQSWTPCKYHSFLKRQCDYSPHGVNSWFVSPAKSLKKPAIGWCSWYAFGKHIDEAKILSNSIEFAKYKVKQKNKYILIDDGWTVWGDWKSYNSTAFPRGIKYVAQEISKLGLKPGIWIAPFLVDNKSLFAHLNPNLLVRGNHGFVDGFRQLPISWPFAKKPILDIESHRTLTYLKNCIANLIENWGIELLKIDFLYAIYFNPVYKSSEIPDQIMHEFLKFIRSTYPHVYTIACGCPYGPASGVVDSVRISADIINPYLDNIFPINKIINYFRLKQLESNIRFHKPLREVWNLDPDVFVARKSTGFSSLQVKKLYKLIKECKGNLFLGDDLVKRKVNFSFD